MPGFICGHIRGAAYKRREMGGVRKIKRTWVSCSECGTKMAGSSIWYHMEQSHLAIPPQMRGVDVGGGNPPHVWCLFPLF